MKDSFAVLQLGGVQHIVSEGDEIVVNRLDGKVGDKIKITDVYLTQDDKDTQVGTPTLDCTVTAEIVDQFKGDKVQGLKFKAKSRYRIKYGHRQNLTRVKIEKISKNRKAKSTAKKSTKTSSKKSSKTSKG